MTYLVTIHANNVVWQRQYLERFKSGFMKKGLGVRVTNRDEYEPGDINVVFANNSWKKTVAECRRRGELLLTVNRCFFGSRFDMVSIGWDGFNGDADFCQPHNPPPARWLRHGVPMMPWKWPMDDGYVLVCGEYRDMGDWYRKLRHELRGEDVRFRPHPFKSGMTMQGWGSAPGKAQDDIETALAGAKACITWDSIAGCDAALAGVPSIAYGEKSMARAVSFLNWKECKYFNGPCPDRDSWAHSLAYCQWTHDEIERGDFWDHLSVGVEARCKSG